MNSRGRRAAAADAPALVRFLAKEPTHREEACERLASILAHDTTIRCWVAEYEGQIVGAMVVREWGSSGKPTWLIESIFIEGTHRKQGLTRLLLGAARADARVVDVENLTTLCMPKDNENGDCLLKGRLY